MTRMILRPKALVLLWLLLMLPLTRAAAQDSISDARERELQHLRQRIEQTKEARDRLQREQQALNRETQRISQDLVRLAAQVQALEQRIAQGEQRIASLQRQQGAVLARLAGNRAVTARLLAALQRLRRDPPPPFVTRPDDVLAAVRSALAMGAVLPRLEARTAALKADLEQLARLQQQLRRQQTEQQKNLQALRQTSARLQGMLKLKQELLGRTRRQLAAQEQQLAALLRQARTLNELLKAVDRRQASAPPATKMTPPAQDEATPAPSAPGKSRPAPAVAFSRLQGRLPWPAQGRKVAGFGDSSRLLGRLKGLYLATLPRALVTAPARGRVLLAGNFRGYGKLVILNVGEGYRILLAGLHEVSVRAGEEVRAGEPVGRMGTQPAPSTVVDETIAGKRPILYMELRKGRKLLDPSGWFIAGRRQARRN